MNWSFTYTRHTTSYDEAIRECIKHYPEKAKITIAPWEATLDTVKEIHVLRTWRSVGHDKLLQLSKELNQHMEDRLTAKGHNYGQVVENCMNTVNNQYFKLYDQLHAAFGNWENSRNVED